MPKFIIFVMTVALECQRGQVLERAAGLTFRILLAFFPFLIFLMALMGFLDINQEAILEGLYSVLPGDIAILVANFVYELGDIRSAGVLSTALFFSVYNSSNGFRAIVRITNQAYGTAETRGIIAQVAISFALMLLFSATIIIMLALLIFERQIWALFFPRLPELVHMLASGAIALVMLMFVTVVIFKLSTLAKVHLVDILPGAALTVVAWTVVSHAFGFAISNFTQYPAVYGSIAGVFVLILWLNIICAVLLVCNEINALLWDLRRTKKPVSNV